MQELVYQKQRTTYKDVANELIEQLKQNSEMKELTGLADFSDHEDGDEEDSSAELPNGKSPTKRGKQGDSASKRS